MYKYVDFFLIKQEEHIEKKKSMFKYFYTNSYFIISSTTHVSVYTGNN